MCFLSRSRILDRIRSRSQNHQESGLRDLRTTSAVSLTLPETSVPHRDGNLHNHVLEDAKALRDIFSTPSSVRGYEAARVTPALDPTTTRSSVDADVARKTPTKSSNSKFGALGHAVKQRLSESRLSKESSRTIQKNKPSLDSPGRHGIVSTSFTSTALTDLLMSRTASEGGYDSDAKDISTLRLRKSSNHESLRISPEYLSEALRPHDNPSPEKTSSALLTHEHKPDLAAETAERQDVHEKDACHEPDPATVDGKGFDAPEFGRANINETIQWDKARNLLPSACQSLSDDQSIHLGDMRISQRLASTSVMPMSSLSSTNFGSGTAHDDGADLSPEEARFSRLDPQQSSMDDDLPWHLHHQPSATARYASFITQEHNRKPSDPKTRKLFEDAADASKPPLRWKSIISVNNMQNNMQNSVSGGHSARDDASSHYNGEDELHESGAASLLDIGHSETVKNANSLAVPGRRASAGIGRRNGSLGQLSDAEEGAWFGDRNHKKQDSLKEFKDVLVTHEKGAQAVPVSGKRRKMSRESKFTEEPMRRHSRELRRLLPSVEANEGMSEITDGMLQEKRHERMSEVAPDAQVLGARFRGGIYDTRSTSEGWLTQGRRSGFGYDFIKRTPSRDSRLSQDKDIDRGPRNETATLAWDRALKKAGEEGPNEGTSRSMLGVPFWSNLKKSRSSLNEQQAHEPQRPRSVASNRRAIQSELLGVDLDSLENHQRMVVEARKPVPKLSAQWSVKTGKDENSQATSLKESSRKRSPFGIRRYTITGVSDESNIPLAGLRGDLIPSWCKFPSHAREDRNGPAAEKDCVRIRDFCPPNRNLEKSDISSNFTIQKNRSASSHGTNFPGSWRKRALGHMRRKSKSMSFSRVSTSPKNKPAHRSLFWQLRAFYRSQSSDLRRFQGGHRSSVTLARESEYPELDIPAGFGSLMPFTISPTPFSRRSSDQAQSSESTGEDSADSVEQRDTNLQLTDTGSSTGDKTEKRFLAGEAKKWSSQKRMHKTSTSKGFDGTVSSRISEEYAGDTTESDCELNSGQQIYGNGTYGSFVSVSASNGFGDESGDFSVQTREFRLASTELRDSTIDFRNALMEREKRSRDDLLRLTHDLDGVGEGGGEREVEEKKKHSKNNTASKNR